MGVARRPPNRPNDHTDRQQKNEEGSLGRLLPPGKLGIVEGEVTLVAVNYDGVAEERFKWEMSDYLGKIEHGLWQNP